VTVGGVAADMLAMQRTPVLLAASWPVAPPRTPGRAPEAVALAMGGATRRTAWRPVNLGGSARWWRPGI